MRFLFVQLAMALSASFVFAQNAPNPNGCIHLKHDGQNYSLTYSGRVCLHRDYPSVPSLLYKPLASWAFNASYAKIVSAWDRYRILARLATLEESERHGFAMGPCAFGPWSDNEWAHHAEQAFLGLTDADSKLKSSATIKAFSRDAQKLRFANHSSFFGIEFKEKKTLSGKDRLVLVKLFSDLEDQLESNRSLRSIGRTLEEAVHEARDSEIQQRRRANFGVFQILVIAVQSEQSPPFLSS